MHCILLLQYAVDRPGVVAESPQTLGQVCLKYVADCQIYAITLIPPRHVLLINHMTHHGVDESSSNFFLPKITFSLVQKEGMSQHFHIWSDKQTIQGLWPNCIWKDKQNQGKGLVLEPKTRKPKCILHKNSWLDFFQTHTSRRVVYLCIFLYMKS